MKTHDNPTTTGAVFTEAERCPRCKGTGFIGKAVDVEGKPIPTTGEQEIVNGPVWTSMMREQEATTTGEWTPAFVMEVREGCEIAGVDFDTKIANGHNAALAALQQDLKAALDRRAEAVQQLAAERERSNAEYMELSRRYNAAVEALKEREQIIQKIEWSTGDKFPRSKIGEK